MLNKGGWRLRQLVQSTPLLGSIGGKRFDPAAHHGRWFSGHWRVGNDRRSELLGSRRLYARRLHCRQWSWRFHGIRN